MNEDEMKIQQMMQQAQNLQKKMSEMQKDVEDLEIVGESGGGVIKITRTVNGSFITAQIDNSLYPIEDKEMLEDLIIAALNDGQRKSKELMEQKMSGLGLPPDLLKMVL